MPLHIEFSKLIISLELDLPCIVMIDCSAYHLFLLLLDKCILHMIQFCEYNIVACTEYKEIWLDLIICLRAKHWNLWAFGKKDNPHIIWISSFLKCINIYQPSMVLVFLKCQKANMRTDRLLTKLLKTKSTKFLRRALNRNKMKTPTKELIQITAVRIYLISPRVKWSCHDRSIKILSLWRCLEFRERISILQSIGKLSDNSMT